MCLAPAPAYPSSAIHWCSLSLHALCNHILNAVYYSSLAIYSVPSIGCRFTCRILGWVFLGAQASGRFTDACTSIEGKILSQLLLVCSKCFITCTNHCGVKGKREISRALVLRQRRLPSPTLEYSLASVGLSGWV